MRRRPLIAVLGFALLAGQTAAQSVHLEFGRKGSWEAFVAPKMPDKPPTTSVRSEEGGMDVPTASALDSDLLIVWDQARNNVAAKPLKNIPSSKNWDVKPEEFAWLGKIDIRLEHQGKPVKNGRIVLIKEGRTASQLLTEESGGTGTFFGFREGELKVEATVPTESGDKTLKQSFDVRLKREDAPIRLIVAVPDATPTIDSALGEAKAGASSEGAATKTQADSPPPNPLGQAVVYLFGIAVAGGAVYAAMRLLKQDNPALKSQLEKLGVQIPTPSDEEPADLPPPTPAATPKPEPILLDPVGAASVASIDLGTAVPLQSASLVSPIGHRFAIVEGTTLIGREDGLPISLSGESTVSRRHAEVVLENGSALVRDLGSTNGTFVNGSKVTGEHPLRPGDELQVGAVRLRFEGT